VQIHRRRDVRLGTDHRPDGGDQVALCVGPADHAHRTVNVQQDAVQWAGCGELLHDLRGPLRVRLGVHGTAGKGPGVHEWYPFDVSGPRLGGREPGVSREQRLLPGDLEVVGGAQVG